MAKLSVAITPQDHVLGHENAEITLLEYGDYQCPHCATAHRLVKQLQEHYGPRLRFAFRNFPLTEIHPMAEAAAEAAEFAAANGKFWEMYDSIFEHQRRLSVPMLVETAEGLGLDGSAARTAVEQQQFIDRIEKDIEGAESIGVHATPTFFINGDQFEGDRTFEALVAGIDKTV